MTDPLVRHLCEDATFLYEEDSAAHKEKVHSGENEYRKRVLFLMEQSGSRPVNGQEKRIILQNVAHFQQFSRRGTKGNTFARMATPLSSPALKTLRSIGERSHAPFREWLLAAWGRSQPER